MPAGLFAWWGLLAASKLALWYPFPLEREPCVPTWETHRRASKENAAWNFSYRVLTPILEGGLLLAWSPLKTLLLNAIMLATPESPKPAPSVQIALRRQLENTTAGSPEGLSHPGSQRGGGLPRGHIDKSASQKTWGWTSWKASSWSCGSGKPRLIHNMSKEKATQTKMFSNFIYKLWGLKSLTQSSLTVPGE